MKFILSMALVLLIAGCTSQTPVTTTTSTTLAISIVPDEDRVLQMAEQISVDLDIRPIAGDFADPTAAGAPEFVPLLYSDDYFYNRNNESIILNFVLMTCKDKCLDEYYELILADEETYKERFKTVNFTTKTVEINGKEVLENIRIVESNTLCPPDELTCEINMYFFFWEYDNTIIQARGIANYDMEETYIEILGKISLFE